VGYYWALYIAGIVLLLLSGVAGVLLVKRALEGNRKVSDETTLWWLFIVGMAAGFFSVWVSIENSRPR
jgi:hypothetical protein